MNIKCKLLLCNKYSECINWNRWNCTPWFLLKWSLKSTFQNVKLFCVIHTHFLKLWKQLTYKFKNRHKVPFWVLDPLVNCIFMEHGIIVLHWYSPFATLPAKNQPFIDNIPSLTTGSPPLYPSSTLLFMDNCALPIIDRAILVYSNNNKLCFYGKYCQLIVLKSQCLLPPAGTF